MIGKVSRERRILPIALVISVLIQGAVPAFGRDGKKHFKEGIRLAENKQWDKAAERLALALSEEPSNAEYQLHLRRALVNAAIMFVERGDRLAAQKDHNAAYSAYRQACAFDVTNEVAAMKMRRMLEAQGIPVGNVAVAGGSGPNINSAQSRAIGVADTGREDGSAPGFRSEAHPVAPVPARMDVIVRNGSLLGMIEQIAQTTRLNVAFDQQVESAMKSRLFSIELRDVTAGEALETILHTHNLTYAQVGARTIVITMDTPQSRARYEPMSMRTFFLKNADINDLRAAISSLIGTKQVVASKQLNALVVRDSKQNLELIDSMIASLDKSKAEVLIDVDLYEVSKNDLLQLGNQFNVTTDGKGVGLDRFGGIDQQSSVLGMAARTLTGPFGVALGLPASTLSIFQAKGKARLLASTQVHVLDNEQHQIRIGQRVPVKTGSSAVFPVGSTTTGTTNTSNVPATFDNIQYENVGLNIDVQPQVFDDRVLVKMKIESSSVDRSTGPLTPSFNQRTMSSIARIRDGQTTMIAGVSRTEDSREVKGLPIVGLVPIIGRFFTTPATNNQQSDIVITVTPHILRRAEITADDHLAKDAGRGADTSTQHSIQEIIDLAGEAERRQKPVAADTARPSPLAQIPAGQAPATGSAAQRSLAADASGIVKTSSNGSKWAPPETPINPEPQIERWQVDRPGAQSKEGDDDDDDDFEEGPQPVGSSRPVLVSVQCSAPVVTAGQNFYVAINVAGDARISSSLIALDYDASLFEVKRVADSGLLRAVPRYSTDGGRLSVRLEQPAAGGGVPARGQLLLIVLTAKAKGDSELTLSDETGLYSPSGQPIPVKLQGATVDVK